MESVFDEQILADKLSKLNNTQQCIETLSHWCIFHRKKAESVVGIWEKQFHSSQKDQKVPFLYLANDIIQNSRRNGNEFVAEFWKVLPSALKEVVEGGDDRGKGVVSRLVKIWEERKVFGSNAKHLKDLMLGSGSPPVLDLSLKRSRSVRILKRDSRSVKLKLSVGGAAEKIVSAFHDVISDRQFEDQELKLCQAAVNHLSNIDKHIDLTRGHEGDAQKAAVTKELQEQQSILKQSVEKLRSMEMNRAALVNHLREALHDQESELENIRNQLKVARAQIDEAANMRRRLNNEPLPKKSTAAIAAEIADKLTASSRSQQIMTSVLSSFAAEEAKNSAAPPVSDGRLTGGAAAAIVPPPQQYPVYPSPPQFTVQPSMLYSVPYTYASHPPPPPPIQVVNLTRPPLTPPPPSIPGPTLQPPMPSYRPIPSSGMAFYQHRPQ